MSVFKKTEVNFTFLQKSAAVLLQVWTLPAAGATGECSALTVRVENAESTCRAGELLRVCAADASVFAEVSSKPTASSVRARGWSVFEVV